MTAFGLFSQTFNPDNRTWLADDHGTEIMPGVPVDLTLLTAGQHYVNGFIPSGTVLGKKTAGGKFGPYLDAASDGTQTAVGITFNPIPVYAPGTATLLTNIAVPILIHGFVIAANLPFTVGNAAAGGYLDAAAQVDLKNIIFVPAVA
jgi:hypothetical protein